MITFKESLLDCYLASDSDAAFFDAISTLLDQTIGYKLLTFTVLQPNRTSIRRIYSSNEAVYPVGGDKPVPDNHWAELTIEKQISFIGNNRQEIEKYFFDHQTITSLGCESILNQVVVFNGATIGTINLLHAENHFRKEHLEQTELTSKFAAPFYLDSMLNLFNLRQ